MVLQVRVNSEQERFLIVPFGLLYSEVTASSLVRICADVFSYVYFLLFLNETIVLLSLRISSLLM